MDSAVLGLAQLGLVGLDTAVLHPFLTRCFTKTMLVAPVRHAFKRRMHGGGGKRRMHAGRACSARFCTREILIGLTMFTRLKPAYVRSSAWYLVPHLIPLPPCILRLPPPPCIMLQYGRQPRWADEDMLFSTPGLGDRWGHVLYGALSSLAARRQVGPCAVRCAFLSSS
jgi:hypothetical protein